MEDGCAYLCSSGTWCVPCRCAEEFCEGCASYHCVGSHFFHFFGGKDAFGGNSAVCRIASQGDHGCVAVSADNDAFDFGCVSAECLAEEVFEAGAVECATHAYDAVFGQTCHFVDEVGHGVHWVADAENYSVG